MKTLITALTAALLTLGFTATPAQSEEKDDTCTAETVATTTQPLGGVNDPWDMFWGPKAEDIVIALNLEIELTPEELAKCADKLLINKELIIYNYAPQPILGPEDWEVGWTCAELTELGNCWKFNNRITTSEGLLYALGNTNASIQQKPQNCETTKLDPSKGRLQFIATPSPSQSPSPSS